jgi:hypothetical protein
MRVEWVHPTWRDLVIEMLIGDDGARRHFLRCSGVHGVELALSTAGGVTGERRLPLLRCDADWDALADRLYELAVELDSPDLIAALSAIAALLAEVAGQRDLARESTALARTVLSRAASVWNAGGQPIAVDLLDAWLALGAQCTPRPKPPQLAPTWSALLPVRTPRCDDRVAVERFADWLVLCELLRGYDGLLLDELGFGPDQLALALAFALEVERHPDLVTPATEDATLRAVECIAKLAPEYIGLPTTVVRMVRRGSTDRGERNSLSQIELAQEFAGLGPLDVGRVLSDL